VEVALTEGGAFSGMGVVRPLLLSVSVESLEG